MDLYYRGCIYGITMLASPIILKLFLIVFHKYANFNSWLVTCHIKNYRNIFVALNYL